jgi:hypothetical protein
VPQEGVEGVPGVQQVQVSARSRSRRPLPFAATAAVAALAGAVLALGAAGGAQAAPASSPSATAATSWLEHQITANGGGLPGSGLVPGHRFDLGLTEDAVLALGAAGEGSSPAARAAAATVAAQATWFTTVDVSSVRLAGPLAKTLLVAEVQGANAHSFGGTDIEARLRAIMATSGAGAGRFEDQGAGSDSSNGFSQALAVLALLRTTDGVPAAAVTFLLQQQCPDGGFRLLYDSGSSCTAGSVEDPDATGLAVQALSALPTTGAVTVARDRAVAWLKATQNAATGSFSGSGPTANVPNANSTGLAASGLRLGGETAAAAKAQAYLQSLQLGSGKDAGAVAYDPAGRAAAPSGTIGGSALDQWRRATAQAVLGLGLPSYGEIVAVRAAPPTSPGSSPSSSSHTSSRHSGGPSTVRSTGPARVLGEQVANDGTDPALAATGGVPTHLLLLALGLLAAGVGVTFAATDRGARHR